MIWSLSVTGNLYLQALSTYEEEQLCSAISVILELRNQYETNRIQIDEGVKPSLTLSLVGAIKINRCPISFALNAIFPLRKKQQQQ